MDMCQKGELVWMVVLAVSLSRRLSPGQNPTPDVLPSQTCFSNVSPGALVRDGKGKPKGCQIPLEGGPIYANHQKATRFFCFRENLEPTELPAARWVAEEGKRKGCNSRTELAITRFGSLFCWPIHSGNETLTKY